MEIQYLYALLMLVLILILRVLLLETQKHPFSFLGKVVLIICSKFTGEHPFQENTLCSFIEIGLMHGCSPVKLPHDFRASFPKSTSGRLLLQERKIVNIFLVFLKTLQFVHYKFILQDYTANLY